MEAIKWRMTEKELLYLAALMNYQELYFVDCDVPSDLDECKTELARCKRELAEKAWIEEDFSGRLWVLPELNVAVHICANPQRVWMREGLDEDGDLLLKWYYECDDTLLMRDMISGEHELWLGTEMLPPDVTQVYPQVQEVSYLS